MVRRKAAMLPPIPQLAIVRPVQGKAVTIMAPPHAPRQVAMDFWNFVYCIEVQSSTNLVNWSFVTNAPMTTTIKFPADKPQEFFRARQVDMRDGSYGPWAVRF